MAKTRELPAATEIDTKSDNGVLSRSLGLLSVLVEAAKPMSLREIAEVVQLHDSTVHRLLQALCDIGYVGRSASRKYFALGKSFLPLSVYHPLNAIRRDSYESLVELRELFGVTASLLVFIGTDRMLLDLAGSSGLLAPFYSTHLNNPLHVSAAGKLILQRMTDEERAAFLGPPPYQQLTPLTKTTEADLNEDLALIVERGYATSIDENFTGMSAIAAPLLSGSDQIIGSLVLVGSTSRFSKPKILKMGAALLDRARLISIGSAATRAVGGMFAVQNEPR
ncbi:MAG: IclR family transcriptional regulator [Pseudomonadota bacterium]